MNMNRLRSAPSPDLRAHGLVGASAAIQAVWQWFEIARGCFDPVLIQGETGTGKRTLAKLLAYGDGSANVDEFHLASMSPEEQHHQWHSWLAQEKEETADGNHPSSGSVLVLHGVQHASSTIQAHLADLLSSQVDLLTYRPHFRLIATSAANLVEAVVGGLFSKELYWRLNVFPIALPPLRRRPEDLFAIIEWIGQRWESAGLPTIKDVDPLALKAMARYTWPGNWHELIGYLRAAAVSGGGPTLTLADLPLAIREQASQASMTAALGGVSPESLAREYVQQSLGTCDGTHDVYNAVIQPIERELIAQVLRACDDKQVRAAERLGISRNTLHKKIKEYGLATLETNANG